jgi:hypothetical protein
VRPRRKEVADLQMKRVNTKQGHTTKKVEEEQEKEEEETEVEAEAKHSILTMFAVQCVTCAKTCGPGVQMISVLFWKLAYQIRE